MALLAIRGERDSVGTVRNESISEAPDGLDWSEANMAHMALEATRSLARTGVDERYAEARGAANRLTPLPAPRMQLARCTGTHPYRQGHTPHWRPVGGRMPDGGASERLSPRRVWGCRLIVPGHSRPHSRTGAGPALEEPRQFHCKACDSVQPSMVVRSHSLGYLSFRLD